MTRKLTFLLAIGLIAVAAPLVAQDGGWGWDRMAGANAEGNFGNTGWDSRARDYGDADSGAATPYTTGYGNYGDSGAFAAGYGSDSGQAYGSTSDGYCCPYGYAYSPYQGSYGQYTAAYGGEQPAGAFSSTEPSNQAPVRVGERVQPAGSGASIMLGQQTIGFVPQGEVLSVWDVQGPWIGTQADLEGREVRGWIHFSQLAPVSVATTRMR